jgi:hypothetical protein
MIQHEIEHTIVPWPALFSEMMKIFTKKINYK